MTPERELRVPGEDAWLDELIPCDGHRDKLRTVLRAYRANLLAAPAPTPAPSAKMTLHLARLRARRDEAQYIRSPEEAKVRCEDLDREIEREEQDAPPMGAPAEPAVPPTFGYFHPGAPGDAFTKGPVVPERGPQRPIFHTADQERAAKVLKGIVAVHSRRIGFSNDYPDLFLADIIDYFAAEFAEVRLAAAPRAAGGQREVLQARAAECDSLRLFLHISRDHIPLIADDCKFQVCVDLKARADAYLELAATEPQVEEGGKT